MPAAPLAAAPAAGSTGPAPVLQLDGITKRFGPLLANDSISLELGPGEIVALLGENGAGKTTLMNILFGHYTPDSGSVRIMGRPLPPGRPMAAIRAGIGMVHQHFSLAPNLTVLDNVMTGTEALWRLRSDRGAARARLAQLSARFGLPVRPDARVADLSVGERQRVEILKALYNDARILVLDEPTAVLTTQEAAHLFDTLRGMAADGLSLIFISHKLDEVMAAAHRIVILRSGRKVAERRPAETTKAELAALMVGRAVTRPVRRLSPPGPALLEARGLGLRRGGVDRLSGVDLTLHAGEVLGIVGVSGNGQTDLAHVLGGTARPTAGTLRLAGETLAGLTVAQAVARGIGRIPEDRNHEGVVGAMAVWENAILERVPRFSRRGLVDRPRAVAFARALIEGFDIRGAHPGTRTQALSGGNVQKLILGRTLASDPRIVIAAQPARGLDEGAVAAVHARLLAARDSGAAVLLISEDLDEVMDLADRIQAIVGGRLSPPIPRAEADRERLGLMMAGEWTVAPDAAAAPAPGAIPDQPAQGRPDAL